MTAVFVFVLLFLFKPTRLAMGYLVPSYFKIKVADWYVEAWEHMNGRKTLLVPLVNHPLADTVHFRYDMDSFFIMTVYQNKDSMRRSLQYLRPTDLPVVVIEKRYYSDSTVELLNYFHRNRLYRKVQRGREKRAFSKQDREQSARELRAIYRQMHPYYQKP